MIRAGVVLVCVFCVATLLAEASILAYLWSRGQLTPETLKDIRILLTGQVQDDADMLEQRQKSMPSTEDIVRERTMRILELGAREDELTLLKTVLNESGDQVLKQRQNFEELKKEFEDRLTKLNDDITSEATEQSRAILLALPPRDAVSNLMSLELEANIVLLKGMPEKSIAKILQEFAKGPPEEQKRGLDIFEAISQGKPAAMLIDETTDSLSQQPALAN